MELFAKWLPYILAGVSVGGQYALIAIGYTMVYGILRLINFAHGDMFMMAGLVMIYLVSALPIWLSVIVVIIFTVALGCTIEEVAYRPLRSAPRMSIMISAIGVSYFLQNIALYVTGGLTKTYPSIPFLQKTVTVLGAHTKMVTVITPILTIALVFALVMLINHTKIGMAMRAVSRDFETSELMGIDINRVIIVTFITGVNPMSGSMPGLKAFVAAVFGGIGSVPGAVVGAFVIGICENIMKGAGLTTFSDAFTFVLLIVILMVKPTGIFGEKNINKV